MNVASQLLYNSSGFKASFYKKARVVVNEDENVLHKELLSYESLQDNIDIDKYFCKITNQYKNVNNH